MLTLRPKVLGFKPAADEAFFQDVKVLGTNPPELLKFNPAYSRLSNNLVPT